MEGIGCFLNDPRLIAYWRLNGNSNDSDASFNGTDTAMTYVTGRYGQAGSFDGVSSQVSVANSATLSPATMTLAFWINPITLPAANALVGLIDKRDNTSGTAGYLIQLYAPSGVMEFWWGGNGASGVPAEWSYPVPAGAWTHVALTHTANTAVLYVNGQSQGSKATFAITNFATALLMGNRSTGEHYNGLIDDVLLFNKVLLASEIHQLGNDPTRTQSFRPNIFAPGNAR